MKNFYKLVNGRAVYGSGKHIPEGFFEFDLSSKPQELLDAENLEKDETRDRLTVLYNGKYYSNCFSCLTKLTAIHSILTNPTDTYTVEDYYNSNTTLQKTDVKNIIELILNKKVI